MCLAVSGHAVSFSPPKAPEISYNFYILNDTYSLPHREWCTLLQDEAVILLACERFTGQGLLCEIDLGMHVVPTDLPKGGFLKRKSACFG